MGQAANLTIIGIDPGVADTGWGVIRTAAGGRLECLGYGSIRTPAKTPLPERLMMISRELAAIIARYRPERAAVEELFFSANAKTALIVGQARGVAVLTLCQAGLPVAEFTPLQVKQAVTAYGRADKAQIQRMVKLILGLEELPRPDDAADALAIAIAGTQQSPDHRL